MKRSAPLFPADSLPVHDFMTPSIIWHSANFPWFNVTIRMQNDASNSLMVPSLAQLKQVLAQQGDDLKVESIEYVTPGFMNGSGHWKMEPLIEVTELFNCFGWSIPRCRVHEGRVYRGVTLEPTDEWTLEKPVYAASNGRCSRKSTPSTRS